MRSMIAALGLSLGVLTAAPAKADASWLSEALHRYYDPGYYGYYAPPVYDYGDYYAPSTSYYVEPGYVYPPTVYYSTPYYTPGWSYYWWSSPRYYGHWGGHGWYGGHHHGWHGGHGGHHHR